MTYQLRAAVKKDLIPIQNFINSQNYLHRHLDWRDTLEWLGRDPFYLLEENKRILAMLACPPEPAEIAWLRLFGVSSQFSPDKAFQELAAPVYEYLHGLTPRPTLVSLALRDWFEDLLMRQGFTFHQDIVVFMYDIEPPPPQPMAEGINLRPMTEEDLPAVEVLDNLAFEPIWRMSKGDLEFAFQKSSYMTVAEKDGQIIAYQMSSGSGFYAHLARLAVQPNMQRMGIGYGVVQDLLVHYLRKKSCWGVTLNTQHNNVSSIALYHRLGFRETGEKFPVYVHEV